MTGGTLPTRDFLSLVNDLDWKLHLLNLFDLWRDIRLLLHKTHSFLDHLGELIIFCIISKYYY